MRVQECIKADGQVMSLLLEEEWPWRATDLASGDRYHLTPHPTCEGLSLLETEAEWLAGSSGGAGGPPVGEEQPNA